MNRSGSWLANLEALKVYVAEVGHFPSKHTRLNNWCRYQRKRMKAGTMPMEQRKLFEEAAASRDGEHIGGKKAEPSFRVTTNTGYGYA